MAHEIITALDLFIGRFKTQNQFGGKLYNVKLRIGNYDDAITPDDLPEVAIIFQRGNAATQNNAALNRRVTTELELHLKLREDFRYGYYDDATNPTRGILLLHEKVLDTIYGDDPVAQGNWYLPPDVSFNDAESNNTVYRFDLRVRLVSKIHRMGELI